MSFEDDVAICEVAKPLQDILYHKLFLIKNITRFSKEDRHILDKNYHIDIELELENGIKLLGQEKALRRQFAEFNTFTIEFYQNRFKKEKGEFFNLGAQFYCHGYVNADRAEDVTEFIKIYIIKIFDFLEYLKQKPIEELELNTRPSSSNASFYYINYQHIPKEFIYYKKQL